MASPIDETTGYLRLFHAVLPVFIEALPRVPDVAPTTNPTRETLKNLITILRFEIQEMQQVLIDTHAEHNLTNNGTLKASEALEGVLFCLETLVDIKPENLSDPRTRYPRLVALRNWIVDKNANIISDVPGHCATEAWKVISYGNEAARYRQTIRAAQDFNCKMRKIYRSLVDDMESPMQQIFQPQYQPQDDSHDRDIVEAEICQARVVCDTAKDLFSLLTKNKACQPPHSAFIRLTGFGQPEIDMIMSLCEAKGASEKWHQVYLTSKIPSNMREVPQPESICSALRDTRKCKKLLCIYLQTDGSWKCALSSAADRMKRCVEPPDLTLEAQLNARRLLKKDKLNLAVAIARSLFHLLGSPLLQGRWNAENIYVTQTANEVVDTKAYIARQLPHNPLSNGPNDSSNRNRVVLDLGLLLWQLLFGRKVIIEPEDREDEDEDDLDQSFFNALNREHSDSQELFVEKPCRDIIENCLNLYSPYQLDHQTFQEKIYWNVVTPLKNYLEFSYQFKKLPRDLNQVKTAPFPTYAASVKSAIKPSKVLHEKNGQEVSLGKGFMVKDKCDITAGQRKTTSQRPTFAGSNLLAFSGDIKNSSSWLDKFTFVNQRLEALEQVDPLPVRIAVLDTGCDINNDYFNGPGIGQDERLDGHWLDCVEGSDDMVDEDPDKHGTAMVTLLLRLLPHAEIFVFRVAKNKDDLGMAQNRIARAIRYAAQESWNVDIVSLSFGFADSAPGIEEAITYAETLKGGKILFFAAANNQGLNQMEMFPALCESVIPVRGTRHDGSFIQTYNPNTWPHRRGAELYGTISEDVPCDWICGQLVKSGCSVATPIVASIAAMIIRFVICRMASFGNVVNFQELIRTRRGMLSVFTLMTQDQEQLRRYLAPWQLFKECDTSGMGTVHTIGYALLRLPPSDT
ncbi:hypothetical protein BFJ69_g16745 [Fusarium oxysporum]|uniref:Uncharacterized protein n=1 Tax=Fusarium oxysporum TaxID=5507 RepID=A0A420MAB3_FUSOX|nr:hypothetical protein BFJ69_g16745 [Fusarium oxysporum]